MHLHPREQIGNWLGSTVPWTDYRSPRTAQEQNGINRDRSRMDCLWARHLAGRIIRPVAVETDNAPLDAPGHADHAGVLTDRVIHRMIAPVADSRDNCAVAARYRLRSPWAVCDFPYSVEADDLQVGIPEPTLLMGKAGLDPTQGGLTRWQHSIVARTDQVDAFFQPTGRRSRGARAQRDARSD